MNTMKTKNTTRAAAIDELDKLEATCRAAAPAGWKVNQGIFLSFSGHSSPGHVSVEPPAHYAPRRPEMKGKFRPLSGWWSLCYEQATEPARRAVTAKIREAAPGVRVVEDGLTTIYWFR